MNVPNLRFPEFHKEWEIKKAKEIFKNHSNRKHDGNLPILAVTQDKGVVCRDSIDINIKTSNKSVMSYKMIEPRDYVISLRSFQGGIEYSYLNGICSPAYTVLKPKIKIADGFYKLYFKKEGFISKLSAAVIGIREGKQISYSIFSEMELPYPSIQEQEKIAAFLSKVDEKIEKLEKHQMMWTLYKKGILQQIFSQKLRFKDENGKDYPDWEEKTIDSIFDIGRGDVIAKTKLKEIPDSNSCYPVYSSQTQNKGIMGYHDTYDFEGDFLTWTTDGANAGKVMYRNGRFKCSNVCGVLKAKNEFKGMSNECIAEILNSLTYKYVSYVGNPKLMNNIMAKIKINVPSHSEQQKIANFIRTLDNRIDFITKEIKINQKFKKGLLQQLFC